MHLAGRMEQHHILLKVEEHDLLWCGLHNLRSVKMCARLVSKQILLHTYNLLRVVLPSLTISMTSHITDGISY